MDSESGNQTSAIVPIDSADAADIVVAPSSAVAPVPPPVADVMPPALYPAPAPAPIAGARRAAVLFIGGAAAFALAYAFAPGNEDEVVVGVRDAGGQRAPAAGVTKKPAPALVAPSREEVPVRAAADPFVAVSFVPPPPPAPIPLAAPPPPPPPPPKAPPLPFSFVGLLEKGGPKPAAFLARGDALLVVSAGDVVDRDYRIESLSQREIVVTYLPLNERQSLPASGGRP